MRGIAIVGTGAIASEHIKAYLTFPEKCKIVALCDIYPEKAEKLVKSYKLEAQIYQDIHEMLKREDIDLVSICTPPFTHAEAAISSLNAGKHVLVEKPMASSLEECDKMIEAAKRNQKLLSVVAQNRFRNSVMKLKQVLDSQLIGPIVHTQVDSYWWRGLSYYDLWWRGTWEKEGGGCTLNHAVHHIDIYQWLAGAPSEIMASMSNTSHENAEVEDLSIAIGRYPNGSMAQITSSVVHHGEEQQLIFQGKDARVSVPWKVRASKASENGFPVENKELEIKLQEIYDQFPTLSYEGHTGQIDDVLNAIEEGRNPLVDGEQGRKTLEIITSIFQSASLKQTVVLPITKDSPFYTRDGMMKNAIRFYEKKKEIVNFNENTITTGGNY
ncbi:Gfo/Idh/MocA family protein [Sutcliffiella halmapala]|uniref:Gfo/Idh/MocA family protein n=1 Tax=Sutcliffiella halmapala TaxID=79882 RepID=UPI0009954986|nr:Gfo/Idh/MocA family oxidoreductase [Sutcliffiella halmapala]